MGSRSSSPSSLAVVANVGFEQALTYIKENPRYIARLSFWPNQQAFVHRRAQTEPHLNLCYMSADGSLDSSQRYSGDGILEDAWEVWYRNELVEDRFS